MNTNEAICEARRWLDYLDTQRAKAKKMAELARLAKTDHAEALRQKRQLDASPTVYDGGNLEPAVRFLIAKNEALRTTIRDAHTTLSFLRVRNGEDYAFGSYYVQQAWNQLNEAMK